jgi:hypothetical protein
LSEEGKEGRVDSFDEAIAGILDADAHAKRVAREMAETGIPIDEMEVLTVWGWLHIEREYQRWFHSGRVVMEVTPDGLIPRPGVVVEVTTEIWVEWLDQIGTASPHPASSITTLPWMMRSEDDVSAMKDRLVEQVWFPNG